MCAGRLDSETGDLKPVGESTLNRACQVFKALLTRLLFYLHVVVTLIRTYYVHEDRYVVYVLAVPGSLIILEAALTLYLRRNSGWEWKWFIPCTFLYLLTVVPAIILLEYQKIKGLKAKLTNTTTIATTTTTVFPVYQSDSPTLNENCSCPEYTDYGKLTNQDIIDDLEDLYYRIDPDLWLNIIEQWMLVNLVVGRWLLPRGDLSRDRLSQLLFVYFGIAADIMELFEVLEYQTILMDANVLVAIFVSWSACLVQFSLTLTAQARTTRVAYDLPRNIERERRRHILFRTEFWAIVVMMCLQDAPFLCVRLYCMIHHQLFTYNIIFFTVKNALVLALQVYRLAVICYEYSHWTPGPVEHIVLNNGALPTVFVNTSQAGDQSHLKQRKGRRNTEPAPVSTISLIKNGVMSPVIIDSPDHIVSGDDSGTGKSTGDANRYTTKSNVIIDLELENNDNILPKAV